MLLSTAYFPPISYFAKLLCDENIVIDIHEHYIKQTYRNRCKIMAANGTMYLFIPVQKCGFPKVCVKDVIIDYSSNWQKIHWRSIESAYNNSPFFLYYRDPIEKCLFFNHKYLFDLNQELLDIVMKQIQLKANISHSQKYIEVSEQGNDFRKSISPKVKPELIFPFYQQVFADKHGFENDLSVIDLLFNTGPDAIEYLKNITKDIQF